MLTYQARMFRGGNDEVREYAEVTQEGNEKKRRARLRAACVRAWWVGGN